MKQAWSLLVAVSLLLGNLAPLGYSSIPKRAIDPAQPQLAEEFNVDSSGQALSAAATPTEPRATVVALTGQATVPILETPIALPTRALTVTPTPSGTATSASNTDGLTRADRNPDADPTQQPDTTRRSFTHADQDSP